MPLFDWHVGRDVGYATRDYGVQDEIVHPPVVACHSISCDAFVEWLERSDSAPSRWQFEPNGVGTGRVVIYSPSTPVHKRTARAIVDSIRDQVMHMGHEDATLQDALRSPASLVCRNGDRVLVPDNALVPADAPKGRVPTIVVEVAYRNETLSMLQTRLSRWIQATGVHVAIGVKIYTASAHVTIVVMQTGAHPQVVEIGGKRGQRNGEWHEASTAVAAFPLGAVFRGFRVPRALRGHERELLIIDSDDVERIVHHAMRHRP